MKDEINQGYVITDRIQVDPDNAFVLGFNPKAPQPFVTWKCGQNDYYYYGHYFNDQDKAIRDLCARVIEELDDKKERMTPTEPVIGDNGTGSNNEKSEYCSSTPQENGRFKKSKHKDFER